MPGRGAGGAGRGSAQQASSAGRGSGDAGSVEGARRVGFRGTDVNKYTRICQRWEAGHCRFGDRCNFAHGEEQLRQLPPRNAGGGGGRGRGRGGGEGPAYREESGGGRGGGRAGTGGWESALTNTLSPGDKVVTFRYGLFSHLWIDMMQRLGLDVTVIEGRWGDGAYEDKLAEVLKADTKKQIKAVCVVHNETTTGVTSDIPEVRKTLDGADHPALLLVDGVSSIGALDFQFDKWRVDVAVTGSQKALSIPTGLAMVCVSDKALAAQKTATHKRVYYDWADMLRTNPSGNVPYTPILPLLYGMETSLKLLADEGMPNVVARHHRLAEGCRKAVEGWGLQTLCRDPRWKSDSLTVIEVPAGVDSQKVVDVAYAKYNLSLGIGLAEVKGKVFRIGHLGNMDELMLSSALCGAEMALMDAGVPITPGSGVSRAIQYWQETAKVIPTRESLVQ